MQNSTGFSKQGDVFQMNVEQGGRCLSVSVDLDSASEESALAFAKAIAGSLASLEQAAKDVATRDLLETYNSGWNEYEQARDDGTFVSVLNPKLAPEEFKEQLFLTAVEVTGDDCVAFWFGATELFWGHSVIVTVFDGLDWESAGAALFG
jgi:hypothetical protein